MVTVVRSRSLDVRQCIEPRCRSSRCPISGHWIRVAGEEAQVLAKPGQGNIFTAQMDNVRLFQGVNVLTIALRAPTR